MAGETGGNGIDYWSNNGIDSNKIMLDGTTAPGFGHDADEAVFTRPSGKSFIKWNTAADGSGTDYFPGDNVEELLGTNANLYAIWGDIPLIVQKSSIEDIADAVRSKLTGQPALTDKTLSDLPTIITNLPKEFSTTPILQNYGSSGVLADSRTNYEAAVMPYIHKGRPFVYLTMVGTSSNKKLGAVVVIGIPNGGTENEGYRLIWYKVGLTNSNTSSLVQSVSLISKTYSSGKYLVVCIYNGSSIQGCYGEGSRLVYGQVAYEF